MIIIIVMSFRVLKYIIAIYSFIFLYLFIIFIFFQGSRFYVCFYSCLSVYLSKANPLLCLKAFMPLEQTSLIRWWIYIPLKCIYPSDAIILTFKGFHGISDTRHLMGDGYIFPIRVVYILLTSFTLSRSHASMAWIRTRGISWEMQISTPSC